MRRYFLVTLALTVLSVFGVQQASALSISPLRFVYEVQPGDEVAGTITLVNESSARQTYSAVVRDFVASSDETGTPQFLAPGEMTETSIAAWVSFSSSAVSLEAGEQRQLSFSIQIPENARAGGYYGALLFESNTGTSAAEVEVTEQVGALVLISVAGDVIKSGELASFEISSSLVSHLPVILVTRFTNTGDVFLAPSGVIVVSNMLGGETALIPFNPNGGSVLPESTRSFTTAWQRAEVPAETPEIIKEWKNFGLGRYTATLALTYENGEQINSTLVFWVLPWQLLIAGGLAMVLLSLAAHRLKKQKTI